MQFLGKLWKMLNLLNLKILNKNIKLITTERRRCLVSEPNHHTTKFFTKKLLVMQMKKSRHTYE